MRGHWILLAKRRFGPLFVTQFLGALNDNLVKNALILLFTMQLMTLSGLTSSALVNVCAGLFVLPFFIFSAHAGQIADKYEKSMLTRYIKSIEILIILCIGIAFYYQNVIYSLLALFLLGVQSSYFGPIKYSLLPQLLQAREIVTGNAMIEMATNLAILLGTLVGGLLISSFLQGRLLVFIVGVAIAVVGFMMSFFIPKTPVADPKLKINYNLITSTWSVLRLARADLRLFRTMLGISWFWFIGIFILAQLPVYVVDSLAASPQMVTLFLVVFCVGVSLGAWLCGLLSGEIVEIGLVPLGSLGISIFAADLCFATPEVAQSSSSLLAFVQQVGHVRILLDLLALCLFGGIFVVPLYAFLQIKADEKNLSQMIGALNILNACFMVMATALAAVLLALGLSMAQLFLVIACLNVLVAVYIYSLVPEFVMRFLTWIIISLLYRVKTQNLEMIPRKGPAVLICNHISFIDPLIVTAFCRRPIRFVMDSQIYATFGLNVIFRLAKAIPVAPASVDPSIKEQAFRSIEAALARGELVCIFPEGGISRDGEMADFKHGVERIIQTSPVPVIPLALRGLWGSFFSRRYGRAMSRWPRRLFYRIGLRAGEPILPSQVTIEHLYHTVHALRGDWK